MRRESITYHASASASPGSTRSIRLARPRTEMPRSSKKYGPSSSTSTTSRSSKSVATSGLTPNRYVSAPHRARTGTTSTRSRSMNATVARGGCSSRSSSVDGSTSRVTLCAALAAISVSDATAIVVGKRIFHMACRRSTDGLAEVAGHHPQCHVDTRRDSRGRQHVAVLHDVKLVLHGNRRERLSHPVERAPVRGRPPSIEEAGLPEQHRAGADGCECLDFLGALRDPRHHALVADLRARSPSSRHDENVERRAGIERRVGNDAEPSGGHDRVGMLRKHEDLERRRLLTAAVLIEARHGEHFEGATEVEHLDVGKDQDANALALHLIPPMRDGCWQGCRGPVMAAIARLTCG